jgi:hypothetical protein
MTREPGDLTSVRSRPFRNDRNQAEAWLPEAA